MSRLELILIFVLQFEAGVRGEFVLYKSPGHDVTLSCDRESDTTCSNIYWSFDRESSLPFFDVKEGKVQKSSVRADRLSLGSDCSLVINNITAEDAGRYTCQQRKYSDREMSTHLNVLTISPSPPDADLERDGEVTLDCSLSTYSYIGHCQENSIRWVDETRNVLDGEGDGYKFLGRSNCASFLTVKRQRGNNRRYICLFIDEDNNVKVETDYTAVFKDDKRDDRPGKSNTEGGSNQTLIIVGAVVGLVVLLLVIAAVLIKYRKRAEVTEGAQKPTSQQSDDPENHLTYVTVNHSNQQNPPKRKAKEEEVTYSTVRTQ